MIRFMNRSIQFCGQVEKEETHDGFKMNDRLWTNELMIRKPFNEFDLQKCTTEINKQRKK